MLDFDIRPYELSPSAASPLPDKDARNRAMMESVVRSKPNIIYAAGADAAMMAKEYTKQLPIVFGCTCNPGPTSANWHIVSNLCAPEANVTGFTRYDVRIVAPTTISACTPTATPQTTHLDSLFSRRIEILREAKEPAIRRIALIYGEDFDEDKWQYDAKAKALGVTLVRLRLTEANIADLPQLMQQAQAEAGLVFSDSLLHRFGSTLVKVTSGIAKPIIFPEGEADSGAWMHYGPKVDLAARAVDYFIPILQGKKISELPVGFPTEYELVVNHALAQRHGWVFPKRFLMLPQREAGAN
nr:ABC transporter substrate binding protein [uncultured Albidiferax sp.]